MRPRIHHHADLRGARRPEAGRRTRGGRAPASVVPRVVVSLAALLLTSGCYRASEEWVEQRKKAGADRGMEADGPPEGAEPGRGPSMTDGERDGSGSGEPVVSGSLGGSLESLPPAAGGGGSVEEEMRDLFARQEMEGLEALDQAVTVAPEDVESLVRGAFAGVGNDTAKCEEILLYLTVRHPELAVKLADAAARANAGIGTAFQ